MVHAEFIALDRGLLKHPAKVIFWRRLTAAPEADASAIHGRRGARVALLQSPILRTVPQDSTVRVEKNWSSGYPVMFRSNGTT
jgi:hypothetical protein